MVGNGIEWKKKVASDSLSRRSFLSRCFFGSTICHNLASKRRAAVSSSANGSQDGPTDAGRHADGMDHLYGLLSSRVASGL